MQAGRKKLLIIGGIVIAVGAIGGLIAWLFLRPRALAITESNSTQSSLSLVKAGPISSGLNGVVRIDSSFDLQDPSNITHFLTVNVTDGFPSSGNVDFVFVENLNPTEVTTPNFRVENVNSLEYPFALSDDFDPQPWRGGLFVEDGADTAVVGGVGFTFDNSNPGGDGTEPSVNQTNSGGGDVMTPATEAPAQATGPQGHFSRLIGTGYTVEGSITLKYKSDFVDGNVVERPVLVFENIVPPRAPGPFLYLSRRPGIPSFLTDDDVFVPIEGGARNGGFTVRGTFEQPWTLSEDPSTFNGGSWVVWCRPFGVRLGGGEIGDAPA